MAVVAVEPESGVPHLPGRGRPAVAFPIANHNVAPGSPLCPLVAPHGVGLAHPGGIRR